MRLLHIPTGTCCILRTGYPDDYRIFIYEDATLWNTVIENIFNYSVYSINAKYKSVFHYDDITIEMFDHFCNSNTIGVEIDERKKNRLYERRV